LSLLKYFVKEAWLSKNIGTHEGPYSYEKSEREREKKKMWAHEGPLKKG
jgi:hypothetical protein